MRRIANASYNHRADGSLGRAPGLAFLCLPRRERRRALALSVSYLRCSFNRCSSSTRRAATIATPFSNHSIVLSPGSFVVSCPWSVVRIAVGSFGAISGLGLGSFGASIHSSVGSFGAFCSAVARTSQLPTDKGQMASESVAFAGASVGSFGAFYACPENTHFGVKLGVIARTTDIGQRTTAKSQHLIDRAGQCPAAGQLIPPESLAGRAVIERQAIGGQHCPGRVCARGELRP